MYTNIQDNKTRFEIDNTRVLYEIINDQQQNKQEHVYTVCKRL